MRTKFVEATNKDQNWGKFLVMAYDEADLTHKSAVDPRMGLLHAIGERSTALWVVDLQTGEGARFHTSGYAKADLDKHQIWCCPLFEPFLEWLYAQGINGHSDLSRLPDLVQLPDAEFALAGYRRKRKKSCSSDE